MSVRADERLLTRLRVEEFLYAEAALLDAWKLREWLALFTADARYEITPLGEPDSATMESKETLFLVADDHERLEQRVVRLLKPSAHAEYPHSKLRHLYANVRVTALANGELSVENNFTTWRNKRGTTAVFMGAQYWTLREEGGQYRIALKRSTLDLDALVPQGKVSFLL